MTRHDQQIKNMLRVYHRLPDGLIEIETVAMTREQFLGALGAGIPAEFDRQHVYTETMLGWPDAKVEWYGLEAPGDVGFPAR
jgi:hypothetical protein